MPTGNLRLDYDDIQSNRVALTCPTTRELLSFRAVCARVNKVVVGRRGLGKVGTRYRGSPPLSFHRSEGQSPSPQCPRIRPSPTTYTPGRTLNPVVVGNRRSVWDRTQVKEMDMERSTHWMLYEETYRFERVDISLLNIIMEA